MRGDKIIKGGRRASTAIPVPPKEMDGVRNKNKTRMPQDNENIRALGSEESSSRSAKKEPAAARLNIPASAQWYNTDDILTSSEPLPAVPQSDLASLRTKAASLHASLPPPPSTSKSDDQFLTNVLTSGTLSDRLSALTLMAQSSPLHNTRALESLKMMASKKGREESLKALRAIVDWWVGGGAPDYKLKYFPDQPLNHPEVKDSHLVLWYFEDWLKKYFFSVLQLLEALSLDLLPYVRTQAMTLIFQLLDGKPEQEQNLLRLLVNKLGDSEKTVASKASYQLLQILQHHPGMKAVIIREISSLILRPPPRPSKPEPANSQSSSRNSNHHSRYYGIITLNQITLSSSDPQNVPGSLVDLYFKLFREILNETNVNPGLATGTNQSDKGTGTVAGAAKKRPGAKDYGPDRKGKGKTFGTTNAKVTGLAEFHEAEDANSKMISAILAGVNRAFPFAKLEGSIFDEHMDTLFRITHTATFNVSIQALVLIFQVTASKKTVSDRFYRTLYESIIDPRLINSSKQAMWMNLTFKAIKADTSHSRVCAFIKRTLQALGMHQPPFICGTLYMLGQLLDSTPGLRDMIYVPEGAAKRSVVSASSSPSKQEPHHSEAYDPRKREPQYAHAESTCLWELVPLLHHFHPSVSLHAKQILTSVQVTATPDLGLNTLSHFLDRFVYKNPKKPKPRGASAMQPMAAGNDEAGMVRLVRGVGEPGAGTVNEEGFWNKPVAEVPVDQLFFHKFFLNKIDKQKERAKKVAKRKKSGTGDSDDNGDVGGDDAPSLNGAHSEEGDSSDDSDDPRRLRSGRP
ncbi:hypothetical protein BS47DRAFT_37033 [Hydnum rufescens UP504]|uniref:CCAAT-binding factor domain-containing protein n=1 Tax=Hydnum rufescens UP504 TaxID=1448309 RepID=A0A9P6DUR5_9AGAM|nr:hypothetical protein BS47DRAFT_37033 [Hydnum rufescens UP504]